MGGPLEFIFDHTSWLVEGLVTYIPVINEEP